MKYSRGSEIELRNLNNFNALIGTIDKNNPKTIYMKITAWTNTIDFDDNKKYKNIIKKLNKEIRVLLYNNLSSNFKKELTMVDLDIRESGISKYKPSFMNCEITLFQNNNFLLSDNIIEREIEVLVDKLNKSVFLNNEEFKFYKNKREAKNKNKKPNQI